ncbi:MAG: hypothetical protein IPP74_04180 [Alphaproteobacteria bacterium]|nr:hypothetical protein [Alphaproteobacteria bacterium]
MLIRPPLLPYLDPKLLQRYPTHHVAAFMLLAPLFGALLFVVFLYEQLSLAMALGGRLIISGVVFTFLSLGQK